MTILNQQLEASKQTKKLLSFCRYADEDSFWFGNVLDYSEDYIVIQHFSKYGKEDGIIIHPKESFERIDYDDDYAKSMQYVIDHSDEIYKPYIFENNFASEYSNEIILQHFKESNDFVISFQIAGTDYYSGYVKEISKVDFVLLCVGKEGEDLGMSLFKIEDISSIHIDDIDNRKRNLLFKWKKGSL